MRRARSEIVARRARELKPMERRIEEIEAAIEGLEEELKRLHEGMIEASTGKDGPRIAELSQGIHQCETGIDRLFDELSATHTRFEEKSREFDALLAGVG